MILKLSWLLYLIIIVFASYIIIPGGQKNTEQSIFQDFSKKYISLPY